MFPELPTPLLLVHEAKLDANLSVMQSICSKHGVELRPHIKTHKCMEIARRQLQLGAAGLTCAKLGEAEAMLPAFAGIERSEIFLAHSLVDPMLAPRVQRVADAVDQLYLAVTSLAHAPVLDALLSKVDRVIPVMMAVDSGLGREGARSLEAAAELACTIESLPHLKLHGIYTHEGHYYGGGKDSGLNDWHAKLLSIKAEVESRVGRALKLWPGCSVTASTVATLPDVDAVRPGAYVFGDIALTDSTGVMSAEDVALHVLATVVDRPEPGLALLDCGSKTLSSDRTAAGVLAKCEWGEIRRVSEEHGFLTGERVDELSIGDRILLTPAHICPVVNLTDELAVERNGEYRGKWHVDARGKVN